MRFAKKHIIRIASRLISSIVICYVAVIVYLVIKEIEVTKKFRDIDRKLAMQHIIKGILSMTNDIGQAETYEDVYKYRLERMKVNDQIDIYDSLWIDGVRLYIIDINEINTGSNYWIVAGRLPDRENIVSVDVRDLHQHYGDELYRFSTKKTREHLEDMAKAAMAVVKTNTPLVTNLLSNYEADIMRGTLRGRK